MPEDQEVLTADEQKLPNEVQAQLRIARKAEKENAELKSQLANLERKSAIERAGVPEHPARDVVFANYDGPLEAEPIREYAQKMGIVSSEPSGVTSEEQAAMRQILQAGGGAPPSSTDIDAAQAMRNAKSPEEVLEIVRQVQGQPGFKNAEGLIGVLPTY
jgi:hypothetical protein